MAMRDHVKEGLRTYENYLLLCGYSEETARFKTRQILEFSKIVSFRAESGIKTLMSLDTFLITNSLVKVSNTVASM